MDVVILKMICMYLIRDSVSDFVLIKCVDETPPSTSSNGVHAIESRRHDQAMFGTSVARKTQWRGPLALQII